MHTQQWISINEHRPELGSSVLTFPNFKVLPYGNLDPEKEGDWSDNDFWEWSMEKEEYIKVTPYPTHWLPLPEAPTKTDT